MRSRWLNWVPASETTEKDFVVKLTKPPKPGFVSSVGSTAAPLNITRPSERIPVESLAPDSQADSLREARSPIAHSQEQARLALPRGVRIVHYARKNPPIAVESYAVVIDVEKFINAELTELNARLHAPIQIRAGHGVFTILDRLRQVGLELEIDATAEKARMEPTDVSKTSPDDFGAATAEGSAQ